VTQLNEVEVCSQEGSISTARQIPLNRKIETIKRASRNIIFKRVIILSSFCSILKLITDLIGVGDIYMQNLIKMVLAEIVTAIVMERYREETDRKEWCLISRKPDKRTGKRRVLYWFGAKKPSKENVEKQERRIQYFKHK
jgi:hypothetical protein